MNEDAVVFGLKNDEISKKVMRSLHTDGERQQNAEERLQLRAYSLIQAPHAHSGVKSSVLKVNGYSQLHG